jgi:hypothetical protein
LCRKGDAGKPEDAGSASLAAFLRRFAVSPRKALRVLTDLDPSDGFQEDFRGISGGFQGVFRFFDAFDLSSHDLAL